MRQVSLLAFLTMAGSAAYGASPQLLNLVMPDVQVIAGVDVASAKLSPFGQFLLSKIQPAGGGGGLQMLISATGFDPLTDVNEIVMASANPATHSGLVALAGNFKPDQIKNLLGSSSPNATVGMYAGATIFTFTPAQGNPSSLAFLGTTVAVAGDTVTVKAALDRNASGANSLSPALAAEVSSLSGIDDAWVIANSPAALVPAVPANAVPNSAQIMQFLNNVQAINGGVKFGATTQIALDVTANSPQNAEALANVIRLLVGMVSTNGSAATAKNPQLALLLPLLKSVQITTNGSDVDLTLAIPESQLEGIVNNHPAGN